MKISRTRRSGLTTAIVALLLVSSWWIATRAQRPDSPSGAAPSLERMQPIPADKMTAAQKKAAEDYTRIRPGSTFGGQPWMTMLRVPEILAPSLELRMHLQSPQVALPPKLVEFASLIAAAEWTNNWEWGGHAPAAIKAGIAPAVVTAVAEGRHPTGMAEDEEIIYDFCTELFKNRSVSDTTYSRALAKFGEAGIVEATHIAGLTTMMSMMMNVARVQPRIPDGSQPPLVPYPHTLPEPVMGRGRSQ